MSCYTSQKPKSIYLRVANVAVDKRIEGILLSIPNLLLDLSGADYNLSSNGVLGLE